MNTTCQFDLRQILPSSKISELGVSLEGKRFGVIERKMRELGAFVSGNNNNGPFIRGAFSMIKRVSAALNSKDEFRTRVFVDYPWHLNADILLTHDIDWIECWEKASIIFQWEKNAGVNSAALLLTEGPYRMDKDKLEEWESMGVEIGLHGAVHDPAFAFRSKSFMKGTLARCIDKLGRNPVLFRSPALSCSDEFFTALDEAGISRDSSLSVNGAGGNTPILPGPYLYPGASGLVEFPLGLQDSFLFRERAFKDNEAINFTFAVIEKYISSKGLFILNTHPGITFRHEMFYRGFLDECAKKKYRIGKISRISCEIV